MTATAIQAGLAAAFVAVVDKHSVSIDWRATLGIAATAAIGALWKGYAATFRGDPNSASLIKSNTAS